MASKLHWAVDNRPLVTQRGCMGSVICIFPMDPLLQNLLWWSIEESPLRHTVYYVGK